MNILQSCFDCDQGSLIEVIGEYADVSRGVTVVVPDVKMLRCNHCGVELIPVDSDRYISNYVGELSSPHDPSFKNGNYKLKKIQLALFASFLWKAKRNFINRRMKV